VAALAAPPPRPAIVRALHALQLYGAVAIAAFGWGVCGVVGWEAGPWVALWFAGALLAYNLDRVKDDPVDAVNVPERWRATRRWRRWNGAVAGLAGAVLLGLPVVRGDWLTFALVVGGSATCLAYSLPRLGARLKDVPVLKTLLPPTVVAASIFALPWLHGAPLGDATTLAAAIGWAWSYLLANMLLCDLRDLAGDRRAGTRSLPVLLGEKVSRRLVAALAGAGAGLALIAAGRSWPAPAWVVLAAATPLVVGLLLRATRRRRSEGFYEWWVEGMFFLPALVCGAEAALRRI